MRKIIIPTDFSENAFNSLKYAAELFKYEQSEFILLHAYSEEIYNSSVDVTEESLNDLKEKVNKSSIENLEKIRQDILKFRPNPKHTFKIQSSFGHLVDEVNNLINLENADITVMGTRGRTNNSDLVFGSNTVQVMKYVQCPVLCIPEFYKFKSFQKILFPTNFQIPYQRRELKLLAEIARKLCADIHLLYISKFSVSTMRQRENQAFLKEVFQQIKVEFHNQESLHKEEAINNFIEIMKIDLLVMVNSRQSYLESILSPSTIVKIGLDPKIPFLVLQNFNRTN